MDLDDEDKYSAKPLLRADRSRIIGGLTVLSILCFLSFMYMSYSHHSNSSRVILLDSNMNSMRDAVESSVDAMTSRTTIVFSQIQELRDQLSMIQGTLIDKDKEVESLKSKYDEMHLKYTAVITKLEDLKNAPKSTSIINSRSIRNRRSLNNQDSTKFPSTLNQNNDNAYINTRTKTETETNYKYPSEFTPAPALPFSSLLDLSPRSAVQPYPLYAKVTTGDISSKRAAVVQEMLHAYSAYELNAWGLDEYKPLRRAGESTYKLGLTIVDSLDTLYIMGLKEQFDRGVDWVKNHLTIGPQRGINVFETNIRAIGGLLSAYILSQDKALLDKAVVLADALMVAFQTPTKIPFSEVTIYSQQALNPEAFSSLAEAGTLQMEFHMLSRLTNDPRYAIAVDQVTQAIDDLNTPLYTRFISPYTANTRDDVVTLGARVDSTYEYFLKQWLLAGGGVIDQQQQQRKKAVPAVELRAELHRAKRMYLESSNAIINELIYVSVPNKLPFVTERSRGEYSGKMDHLVCFFPGLLSLGVDHGTITGTDKDVHARLSVDMTRTCYEMYKRSPTGLSPEIVYFGADIGHESNAVRMKREQKEREKAFDAYHKSAHSEPGSGYLRKSTESKTKSASATKDYINDVLTGKVSTSTSSYNTNSDATEAETANANNDNDNDGKVHPVGLVSPYKTTSSTPLPVLGTRNKKRKVPRPPSSSSSSSSSSNEPRKNFGDASVVDFNIGPRSKHCFLRPETLESIFYLYRSTHDPKYRDWAWEIFLSLVRYARVREGGYTTLNDVTDTSIDAQYVRDSAFMTSDDANPDMYKWLNWRDRLESFVFAETFKYLYLIFSDDNVIPLDQYVFNTEAHPFPIDPAVLDAYKIPLKPAMPGDKHYTHTK